MRYQRLAWNRAAATPPTADDDETIASVSRRVGVPVATDLGTLASLPARIGG
jgi:hypothetical protein